METFIFALGVGLYGLPADRLPAECLDMMDELAGHSAARRVECAPAVGQKMLGHNVIGCFFVERGDGVLSGFAAGHMGGDRVAGAIIDE